MNFILLCKQSIFKRVIIEKNDQEINNSNQFTFILDFACN